MENKAKIESFHVIGLKVRTSNPNGQSAVDIPQLWEKFMGEDTFNKIPNKIDDRILCLYTNYEGDYSKPYDTIIGCRVSDLSHIPDGLISQSFESGDYVKVVKSGDLKSSLVYETWVDLWKQNIPRKYDVDFEVYGAHDNPHDATVEIFVGVN